MKSFTRKTKIEGLCVTDVKFEKVLHEYFTMAIIHKSIHEILIMNLKEILLTNSLYGKTYDVSIKHPRLTDQDIILPSYISTIGTTQRIDGSLLPLQGNVTSVDMMYLYIYF